MLLTKTLFTVSALAVLALDASAQFTGSTLGSLSTIATRTTVTPPTLPSFEERHGSYDKAFGNSYLGGGVHAFGAIARQKQGSYELGSGTLELRGIGTLLGRTGEVAEIVTGATSVLRNGVRTRSGYLFIDVLGSNVVARTFENGTTYSAPDARFNLFPGDGPRVDLYLGPVSISVQGNAGCGFSRSIGVTLLTAAVNASITASGSLYAFADIRVGGGIPWIAEGGIGVEGKILEQTLSARYTADSLWGLTGTLDYTLKAITLRLYGWVRIFGSFHDKTFTSWSQVAVVHRLL